MAVDSLNVVQVHEARILGMRAPGRPGLAPVSRFEEGVELADDIPYTGIPEPDTEQAEGGLVTGNRLGVIQQSLEFLLPGFGLFLVIADQPFVQLPARGLEFPGAPAVARVEDRPFVAHGPSQFRGGEVDSGQVRTDRHRGLFPVLSVIAGIDDDAAQAHRDQLLPSPRDADQRTTAYLCAVPGRDFKRTLEGGCPGLVMGAANNRHCHG